MGSMVSRAGRCEHVRKRSQDLAIGVRQDLVLVPCWGGGAAGAGRVVRTTQRRIESHGVGKNAVHEVDGLIADGQVRMRFKVDW